MKRFIPLFLIGMIAAVSCDIYTSGFEAPEEPQYEKLTPNTTIKDLKARYTKSAVTIMDDVLIGGQVISSDESGNIYRSIYIQDDTGGLEIKLGVRQAYNDYRPGQWLYIRCKGLVLGNYNGMLQLGAKDDSGQYDTAYMDIQYLIDAYVTKGPVEALPEPLEITEAQIADPDYYGMYVKVTDLVYANQIFLILYDNADNSTYLSNAGTNYGINTWAMSEKGFQAYMTAATGKEEPQSAFEGAITADVWQAYYDAKSAYTLSQYFKKGSTDLQVRTSGYSKFADTPIDDDIIKGAKVTMTGILTHYNANNQFTLNSLDGVQIQ